VLTGVRNPAEIKRGITAAGHKALYSANWGGLPSREFLGRLDPRLAELRSRLYQHAYAADTPAGTLSQEWARVLGVPAGIPVAIGSFDAHYGAVGAGVTPGTLVKIIGTSTCDIAIAPTSAAVGDVPGICGIVNGSVMPGYYGIEAGQSAVGDLLRWWVDVVCEGDDGLHVQLTDAAARLRPGESGLLALDWNKTGPRSIAPSSRPPRSAPGRSSSGSRRTASRSSASSTAVASPRRTRSSCRSTRTCWACPC
jgi:L-ribulokinase